MKMRQSYQRSKQVRIRTTHLIRRSTKTIVTSTRVDVKNYIVCKLSRLYNI